MSWLPDELIATFPKTVEEYAGVPASVSQWRERVFSLHRLAITEFVRELPFVHDARLAEAVVLYAGTRRLHLIAGETVDEVIESAKQVGAQVVTELKAHCGFDVPYDWTRWDKLLDESKRPLV